MEEKVAAIFLAIIPLFPTPEMMIFDLTSKHLSTSLRDWSTSFGHNLRAALFIAFASSTKHSVKLEYTRKRIFDTIAHN